MRRVHKDSRARRTRVTLLCVLATFAAGAVDGILERLDAEISQVVALCPNYDSIVVQPTPWEKDRGRKPRVIHAPPCDVPSPDRLPPAAQDRLTQGVH
jgi:hypothetical protein